MSKRLKKKSDKELTVCEACEKYCKGFMEGFRYEKLLETSISVDSCENEKLKLAQLRNVLKDVSDLYDRLNRIVEYGKYVIELNPNAHYIRKMHYKNKLKFSQQECDALSSFWRYLIITINHLERQAKEIEDKNNG